MENNISGIDMVFTNQLSLFKFFLWLVFRASRFFRPAVFVDFVTETYKYDTTFTGSGCVKGKIIAPGGIPVF